MTLFDPSEYEDPAKVKTERQRRSAPDPIESDGSWIALAQHRRSVAPYAHRVSGIPNEYGAITTRCGKVGRELERFDRGTTIVPCPECKLPSKRKADQAS